MKHFFGSILIIIFCITYYSHADSVFEEEEHEHHALHQEAHEHGIANLQLVTDQTQLTIRLELPMVNLTRFEHQPKTAEEQQLLAQQTKMMRQIGDWAKINGQAACETDKTNLDIEDHDHQGEHHNFGINFSIKCTNLKELHSIELLLFDKLPSLEKVKADWIHQGKQNTTHLTAENPKIIF